MPTRYLKWLSVIMALSDLVLLNLSFICTSMLIKNIGKSNYGIKHLLIANLLWLVCALSTGLYSESNLYKIKRVLRSTMFTVFAHSFALSAYLQMVGDSHFNVVILASTYCLTVVAFCLSRLTATYLMNFISKEF